MCRLSFQETSFWSLQRSRYFSNWSYANRCLSSRCYKNTIKVPQTVLNNRNLLSHSSGMLTIKLPGNLLLWEDSIPDLHVIISDYIRGREERKEGVRERERENKFSVVSSYKDTTLILTVSLHLLTSSNRNYLPKAPSPNNILLEFKSSTYKF